MLQISSSLPALACGPFHSGLQGLLLGATQGWACTRLTARLPALRALPALGTVTVSSCFFGSDKVQALSYAQHTRQLISCGGDGGIVVWNMDVERQEVGSQKARATLPWPPGWALHLRLRWGTPQPPRLLTFFLFFFSGCAGSSLLCKLFSSCV